MRDFPRVRECVEILRAVMTAGDHMTAVDLGRDGRTEGAGEESSRRPSQALSKWGLFFPWSVCRRAPDAWAACLLFLATHPGVAAVQAWAFPVPPDRAEGPPPKPIEGLDRLTQGR